MRVKNKGWFFAFTISCYLVVGMVAAQDVVTVEAVGYGRTPRDAERDALRGAVGQAVGMLINVESMVKNEDLIYDQILTFSDGYVESYKKLSEPAKNTSDIYQVTVEAVVRKNKVLEKLAEVKVISSSVAGQDLWAQQISKIESVEDGRKLLEKFLEELDPKKLLLARVIDAKGRIGDEAEPELIIDYENSENSKIVFYIEVYYDLEAYYKVMVPRATQLFGAIGEQLEQSVGRDTPPDGRDRIGLPGTYLGVPARVHRTSVWELISRDTKSDLDTTFVAVNIGRNKAGTNQRFTIFKIGTKTYASVLKKEIFRNTFERLPPINVIFAAQDGGTIQQNSLAIGNSENRVCYRSGDLPHLYTQQQSSPALIHNGYYTQITISPEFQSLGLSDTLLFKYEATVDADDLKKLKKIKLHF